MGIHPQQAPIPVWHIAQDVLDQTKISYQGVCGNSLQDFIKYKAYYDKKANTTKLKQAEYVYIPQPEADHQGSVILFTELRWIGPYIIEKVLPNNNYLVRRSGTNKTQVLHRMQLRQFTTRQPLPDVQIMSTIMEAWSGSEN